MPSRVVTSTLGVKAGASISWNAGGRAQQVSVTAWQPSHPPGWDQATPVAAREIDRIANSVNGTGSRGEGDMGVLTEYGWVAACGGGLGRRRSLRVPDGVRFLTDDLISDLGPSL